MDLLLLVAVEPESAMKAENILANLADYVRMNGSEDWCGVGHCIFLHWVSCFKYMGSNIFLVLIPFINYQTLENSQLERFLTVIVHKIFELF